MSVMAITDISSNLMEKKFIVLSTLMHGNFIMFMCMEVTLGMTLAQFISAISKLQTFCKNFKDSILHDKQCKQKTYADKAKFSKESGREPCGACGIVLSFV